MTTEITILLIALLLGWIGEFYLITRRIQHLEDDLTRTARTKSQEEIQREGRVEHLYHLVLALARLNLVNPGTLRVKLNERKENVDFATKVFGSEK